MKPGRFIWGLAIMVAGALLLGASLGRLDWAFLLSLLQLWPIVLVMIGIQLLLGRSKPVVATVLMALILVGTVAAAWGLWGTSWTAAEEQTITGPSAAGISQGSAELTVAASRLTLQGQDIDTTVSGTYRTRPQLRVEQSAESGRYRLEVRPRGESWWMPGFGGGSKNEGIHITLRQGIPWDITVNGGAASYELDLTNVTLGSLQINTGASSATVVVGPNVVPGARLDLTGGVGSYRISFPRSLSITVRGETGLTSLDTEGFDAQGGGVLVHRGGGSALEVSLKAGVSSIELDLY
ncbi:MAG: DUF4097 domain-containing protein [Gaiellales bacterium]|nr:DUF4097 domain-containing protein [Gaiellales bacterium]